MEEKILKNALICEQLIKLTSEEKKKAISKLLKNKSVRELGKEIGVPHSTIQLWKNPEVSYNKPINFNVFYGRLKDAKPEDITDWGRLKQIRDLIDNLLRGK